MALWITDGFQNYNVALDGEYNEKQPIYEKNFPFKVGYVPLPLLASGEPSSMFSDHGRLLYLRPYNSGQS